MCCILLFLLIHTSVQSDLISIDSETLKINAMPVWMMIGNMCINSSVQEYLIARVTAILTRFHVLVSHVGSHIFLLFDAASTQ